MIVVSDTSPLNYLVLLSAVDVLPKLFREGYVPPQVMEELRQPKTPEPVKRWAYSPPGWLNVLAPTTAFVIAVRLDPGESQAIALAKQLRATTILIDDKKGRRVAKQEGLNAVGTITVLELAALKNLLELEPALDSLRRTTFRISATHIQAALERHAARKLADPHRSHQK